MTHHHCEQSRIDETAIRNQVVVQLREIAAIHRARPVAVNDGARMRREMLGRRRHSGAAHAANECQRQRCDCLRVGVKRAVTDDRSNAEVEVRDRCKAHVDTAGAQLRSHEPAGRFRCFAGFCGIVSVQQPYLTHRWQDRKRLSEPLYAPAFLIHGNEQPRRAYGTNAVHELTQLLAPTEIA